MNLCTDLTKINNIKLTSDFLDINRKIIVFLYIKMYSK